MPILGAALRKELANAVGLTPLRKELRRELRGLAREIKKVRTLLQSLRVAGARGAPRAAGQSAPAISAAQVRSLRTRLGETRKTFAARLRVSPSIVFLWESGRSSPRRRAIVSRLEQLIRTAAGRTAASEGSSRSAEKTRAKRPRKVSAKRRAALKLQGQYIGNLRNLNAKQQSQVKAAKAARGFPAAIALARKLGKA